MRINRNRNFEGRQGRGAEHLVSPAMATASALLVVVDLNLFRES